MKLFKIVEYSYICFSQATPQQMIVTWSVHDQTNTSYILYGRAGRLITKVPANVTKRVDEGKSQWTQYIHKVVLDNLMPGEVYSKLLIVYSCQRHSIYTKLCWTT